MRTGRFMSSRKAVIASIAAAAALAMGVGGGVAAANQPSSKSGSVQQAAVTDARTCGVPTTHRFSGIEVSVRACLEGQEGDGSHPLTIVYSGDVDVRTTSPKVEVGYCRVELEGSMHTGVPNEIHTLSCADLVNKGMKFYFGARDGRATSDGWTQVSVLVGANKSTARIVMATHEAFV